MHFATSGYDILMLIFIRLEKVNTTIAFFLMESFLGTQNAEYNQWRRHHKNEREEES